MARADEYHDSSPPSHDFCLVCLVVACVGPDSGSDIFGVPGDWRVRHAD